MKSLTSLIIIFGSIWLTLSCSPTFAGSQKLLDELAKSSNLKEAQPIVDALWKDWINAHQSAHEQDLMKRGINAMNQGFLNEAEDLFDNLIQKNPDFVEAWNKRATVRFMQSKFNVSQDDVFEVLKREPRHFGALSGLALIYIKLGEIEKAITTYEKLRTIFPASPEPERYIPLLRKKLGLTDL